MVKGTSELGLTMLEIATVIVVIAILAGIAVPYFRTSTESSRQGKAIAEIRVLELEIERYVDTYDELPLTLADINREGLLDPWGHPYQYLSFEGLKGKGKKRKDKYLNPLNSDYDLYSMGPDGKSVSPLTAKNSRDDLIRANDGDFVGLAADF